MIVYAFLSTIVAGLNAFLSGFPTVTELPYVDVYLVTGFGYLHFLMDYIPPFAIIFAGFVFVMKFKIGLLTLRLLRIIR